MHGTDTGRPWIPHPRQRLPGTCTVMGCLVTPLPGCWPGVLPVCMRQNLVSLLCAVAHPAAQRQRDEHGLRKPSSGHMTPCEHSSPCADLACTHAAVGTLPSTVLRAHAIAMAGSLSVESLHCSLG